MTASIGVICVSPTRLASRRNRCIERARRVLKLAKDRGRDRVAGDPGSPAERMPTAPTRAKPARRAQKATTGAAGTGANTREADKPPDTASSQTAGEADSCRCRKEEKLISPLLILDQDIDHASEAQDDCAASTASKPLIATDVDDIQEPSATTRPEAS